MSEQTREQYESSQLHYWEEIKRRCDAAGIEYEEKPRSAEIGDSPELRHISRVVKLPAGPNTRSMYLYPHDYEGLSSVDFEHYMLLPDYLAIWNRKTGQIEAKLTLPPLREAWIERIWRIPNFEDLEVPQAVRNKDEEVEDDVDILMRLKRRYRLPRAWRMRAEHDSISIEISPRSAVFRQISSNEPAQQRLR